MTLNACYLFLFIRVPLYVPQPIPSLNASPILNAKATKLVDSGLKHKVLEDQFSTQRGFLKNTKHARRRISGFETSTQMLNHPINLLIDDETQFSLFLLTQLKDIYNVILEIPQIKRHSRLIDWVNHVLNEKTIALAEVVLSQHCKKDVKLNLVLDPHQEKLKDL